MARALTEADGAIAYGQKQIFPWKRAVRWLMAKILSGTRPGELQWSAHKGPTRCQPEDREGARPDSSGIGIV
jgi:hypothetical protein